MENFADQHDLNAVWSMDPKAPGSLHNLPSRNIEYRVHWGEKTISTTIEGDTWGDVYIACDKAIKLSGDTHHIFIESLEKDGDVMVLWTGS